MHQTPSQEHAIEQTKKTIVDVSLTRRALLATSAAAVGIIGSDGAIDNVAETTKTSPTLSLDDLVGADNYMPWRVDFFETPLIAHVQDALGAGKITEGHAIGFLSKGSSHFPKYVESSVLTVSTANDHALRKATAAWFETAHSGDVRIRERKLVGAIQWSVVTAEQTLDVLRLDRIDAETAAYTAASGSRRAPVTPSTIVPQYAQLIRDRLTVSQ